MTTIQHASPNQPHAMARSTFGRQVKGNEFSPFRQDVLDVFKTKYWLWQKTLPLRGESPL